MTFTLCSVVGVVSQAGGSDSDFSDWDMTDESTSGSSEDEERHGISEYTADYFLKK